MFLIHLLVFDDFLGAITGSDLLNDLGGRYNLTSQPGVGEVEDDALLVHHLPHLGLDIVAELHPATSARCQL